MCRQSVGRGEGSLLLCVNSGVSLLLLVVLVVFFQDSAVFHKIRDIDFVLTGAEVVVENGGIINTVCSLAISARGLSMQYLLRPVLLNAAFVFVCPRCVCVCACVCVRLCVCVPVCVCLCVRWERFRLQWPRSPATSRFTSVRETFVAVTPPHVPGVGADFAAVMMGDEG